MNGDGAPERPGYLRSEDDVELRVKALESLLLDKGLVTQGALDRVAGHYEDQVGPRLGASVVARAWVDAGFKQRLLNDATAACAELGITGLRGEHLRAVENTAEVHNVIVCTLCSCYPWAVLGLPPGWYKSPEYRAKVVRAPRRTLAEDFGLHVPAGTEVRVWDSNSELRYFVVPLPPPNTQSVSEERLAQLVTRESMIGVGQPRLPGRDLRGEAIS